jgi:uncharacterized membrane protein YfcA
MRVILELLRIILIFAILGGFLGGLLEYAYSLFELNTAPFEWMGVIAILLLLFVYYRNKLQFSGWYKGKGRENLSSRTTWSFILVSAFLLVLVPILSYFFYGG